MTMTMTRSTVTSYQVDGSSKNDDLVVEDHLHSPAQQQFTLLEVLRIGVRKSFLSIEVALEF